MRAVAGHIIAGRYELLSRVGQGAMGTVWRANDPVLAREVAVKEIRLPALIPDQERRVLRERTLREARVAAKLSHPGVVAVYDVVEADGNPWIVMEYVPARSLQRLLDEDGPLPAPQVAGIGATLLDALARAHAVGVVHRDVKPANVLIASHDRAVLTDFGIATLEGDPGLTLTGMVMGTPGFCAPERIRGEAASPASDLWSLGATLYAAVQGHAPFQSQESPMAVLAMIVNSDPPAPTSAGPLGAVILALMSRDPLRRPDAAAAQQMLAQASRALSGASPAPATSPAAHAAPAAAHAAPAAAHTARTADRTAHIQAHATRTDAGAARTEVHTARTEVHTQVAAGMKAGAPAEVPWTWPPRDIPRHPRHAGGERDGAAAGLARTSPLPTSSPPPAGARGSSYRDGSTARLAGTARPGSASQAGGAASAGALHAPDSAAGHPATRSGARTGPAGLRRHPPSRRRRGAVALITGIAVLAAALVALGLMAHAARVGRTGHGAVTGRSRRYASLSSGYRWYSGPAGTPLAGLPVAVPREWFVTQRGPGIVARSRTGDAAITIVPVPEGAVGPIRSLLLLSRQARSGAFPGFHRIAVGSLPVNGSPADTLAFRYAEPGRGPMKGLAVVTRPLGGIGYEFLATAPASHWPAARAALAEALRSLGAGA